MCMLHPYIFSAFQSKVVGIWDVHVPCCPYSPCFCTSWYCHPYFTLQYTLVFIHVPVTVPFCCRWDHWECYGWQYLPSSCFWQFWWRNAAHTQFMFRPCLHRYQKEMILQWKPSNLALWNADTLLLQLLTSGTACIAYSILIPEMRTPRYSVKRTLGLAPTVSLPMQTHPYSAMDTLATNLWTHLLNKQREELEAK